MKGISYLVFAIIVLISACNPSDKERKNVPYNKNGLSFNLPKYWKVKKDRAIDGVANSRFISISDGGTIFKRCLSGYNLDGFGEFR